MRMCIFQKTCPHNLHAGKSTHLVEKTKAQAHRTAKTWKWRQACAYPGVRCGVRCGRRPKFSSIPTVHTEHTLQQRLYSNRNKVVPPTPLLLQEAGVTYLVNYLGRLRHDLVELHVSKTAFSPDQKSPCSILPRLTVRRAQCMAPSQLQCSMLHWQAVCN